MFSLSIIQQPENFGILWGINHGTIENAIDAMYRHLTFPDESCWQIMDTKKKQSLKLKFSEWCSIREKIRAGIPIETLDDVGRVLKLESFE